jgi:hypothetical protein
VTSLDCSHCWSTAGQPTTLYVWIVDMHSKTTCSYLTIRFAFKNRVSYNKLCIYKTFGQILSKSLHMNVNLYMKFVQYICKFKSPNHSDRLFDVLLCIWYDSVRSHIDSVKKLSSMWSRTSSTAHRGEFLLSFTEILPNYNTHGVNWGRFIGLSELWSFDRCGHCCS